MNKWLLIWNLILTVLLMVTVISGCSTPDTRITWLVEQVQLNTLTIEQVKADVSYNKQIVQSQAVQMIALQSYIDNNISQLQQLIQLSGR